MALDAQWSAVARGYRFALILAAVVGAAAVVVCTATGHWLAGVFICVGLGLGSWNSRRLWTDTQLLTSPPPRRPALVHLGRARALIALGKPADARAALAQAVRTEPENAEALELKARLK